ncbi:hypothetical protein TWF730_000590 [Orbilia blumenaviensis]|uniref:Uncharacterized protein n=1 Tax=Orbilia blumenaviensis TaxID=1796055 RepID=A0AAV9VP07_9PEZI
MTGHSRMPVKKTTSSKGFTSSQPNLRLRSCSRNISSSRDSSPNQNSIAQRAAGAFNRDRLVRQVHSINNVRDCLQGEEKNAPGPPIPPLPRRIPSPPQIETQFFAEPQSYPIEDILRDMIPAKSETSPEEWEKLCREAKRYNRLMRWYDGPGDDGEGSPSDSGEDSDDDSRPTSPEKGKGRSTEYQEDSHNNVCSSQGQFLSSYTQSASTSQEREDEDADTITKAPRLPERPTDCSSKLADMAENLPPNEYTKAFPPSKHIPVPKNIRDDPFAYPGAHPHKIYWSGCGHQASCDAVCEETNPEHCVYNQNLKLRGICEICRQEREFESRQTRSQKIQRSIKGVSTWLSRTARTIARGGRRRPIPSEMRTKPSFRGPTDLANRRTPPTTSNPSGTQRSRSAPPPRSSSRGSNQGGDGQDGETPSFDFRGPPLGTAGLPRLNQPMTPEERANLLRLRGPTGSSVGAGGADPTLHADTESDKS